MRRENHIARDLRTPKYRQRRVESKRDKGEKYLGPTEWLKDIDDSE